MSIRKEKIIESSRVNDTAESWVKLIEEVNHKFIKNEKQRSNTNYNIVILVC